LKEATSMQSTENKIEIPSDIWHRAINKVVIPYLIEQQKKGDLEHVQIEQSA
jgi:hypothetical protein